MKFATTAFSLMFLLFATMAQAQNAEQNAEIDASAPNTTTFHLVPNPPFVACLEDSSGLPPKATVVVVRGKRNDLLTLTFKHVKPGLAFDLFTVQHSPFLSNGAPILPLSTLAWPGISQTSRRTYSARPCCL
jgi:hypothetical protein